MLCSLFGLLLLSRKADLPSELLLVDKDGCVTGFDCCSHNGDDENECRIECFMEHDFPVKCREQVFLIVVLL